MVEKAFLSVENYLEFFKEIGDIYESKEDTFNKALSEINAAYGHLLQDEEEKLPRRTKFLKPEIPKNKKENKSQRASSRASRKNAAPANETVVINSSSEKLNANDPDIFRRSSRIASKKTLPATFSPEIQNENELTPNFQSTSDIKSKEDRRKTNSNGTDLEELIMCAAHSTPIVLSPAKDKDNVEDCKTPKETPSAQKILEIEQISGTTSAVKKRIEEFESRAGQGALLPSKLPIRTPTKKKNVQDEKQCVENAPISKSRFLRSNKVLQEKNTNVEPLQNQENKLKKPVGLKNNFIGSKIKMGVQNKYFSQPKKKDLKALKPINIKTVQTGTQEKKQIENESKIKKNQDLPSDEQYEIEHVLGNESSEDEESPKNPIPKWAHKEMREHPLSVQAWIDKKETVYVWFYNKNIKNPKLEELFSETTIKMRPRTSSAVWNTKTYFK